METDYNNQLSSEDDYSMDSSDDGDEDGGESYKWLLIEKRANLDINTCETQGEQTNLMQKLFNRECTGNFLGHSRFGHISERAFTKVPNRLGFCLKDIIPNCFLQGHVFMGLSACGQFLLSYKVCCNDNVAANHYSFNVGYKYTLYFWIYQPHKPVWKYYKFCLFDDHGVDNLKEVKMTQWKNADPRVLIIHGAAEDENEDSYITYIKVPKLGCLECKKLRDFDDDAQTRWYALCLTCNLTVHTKYSSTESDRKFDPYINLICPDRILIISNGFMHMLRIDVETPAASTATQQHQLVNNQLNMHSGSPYSINSPLMSSSSSKNATPQHDDKQAIAQPNEQQHDNVCDNKNNVVARILADFSDIESEFTHLNGHGRHNETQRSADANCVARKTYDELIFTCNGSSASATPPATIGGADSSSASSRSVGLSKISLISHTGKRHHRIVTKSFRNGVVTVDLQGPTTSTSATAASAAAAYEFSEDNEKCEKIATLRKRRLADKKYEFSEDNSENIVPFTKIRSASKVTSHSASLFGGATATRSLHRFSPTAHSYFHNSPCASPSSSPRPSQTSPSICESRHCTPPPPNSGALMGFRSPTPCASPATSTSIMRSPSRHATVAQVIYNQKSSPPLSQATQQMLSFKPLGALSPLQVSMTKRIELGGSMSPNANFPFLSPRRDEQQRVVEVPLQGGAMPEKPICTKKLKRRYVEEDDAASVITSEEDDCISPGYHTSLPMEVHGSCYSEMHMISQASYQKLRCASVVITQHSFDLETFTYYVISSLCQKNQKTYDVFYDWAYELINVCPLSYTITCMLMAQFTARDQLPTTPTNCLNCSRKLDCAFHRRQFECRILFTWNMESGEWHVLDYGELKELFELISPIKKCGVPPVTFAQTAKKLAQEMSASLNNLPDYKRNLRVLDSNVKKSKTSMTDLDNMIEFYLKRRNND